MKKTSLFFALTIGIFACKSKSETTTDSTTIVATDNVATAAGPSNGKMCFLFAENKDSTKISLTIDGDNVTGQMDWLPNEKDGAYGTLKGKKVGDVLNLLFDFTIEGSQEKEEKVFVLQGDKLLEKGGELEFKNGVSKMKNPEKAETVTTLTKVDCQ